MKKKFFRLGILVLAAFSLIACTNNNKKSTNTVSPSKLTEREQSLLFAITDQLFVFDFNVDQSYEQISVWVDKYEFGKKVEAPIIDMSSGVKDKGTIVFTTVNTTEDNKSIFNVSVNNAEGMSSGSNLEKVLTNVSIISGDIQEENTPIAGQMVLASMVFAKGEKVKDTISQDFYQDVNGHIDQIKDYDVVYLLMCEFK
ncbi:hypothetical protein [Lederbergia citrea]|uniref:Lipoprotein n=1 Tax=Lederbergia citrea TaxID=2833581 RepID=A0A942URU3_9BACI|nr:hypothetical protein [Lederbergia citrea]MBS4179421.1 hypothetical protein [Lederbergia citrea]MBS4206089.1 hypothetical protein [Lederbergia citrea]MBS4224462.1 hypothetical protein [Lederbergia citrea]